MNEPSLAVRVPTHGISPGAQIAVLVGSEMGTYNQNEV